MSQQDRITILLLNPDWVNRTHPLTMLFSGGHKAKAGEWFLEVQRVLHDIYKSFAALENFLNRGEKDVFVGEAKEKVEITDAEKIWLFGYMVDNAYLRIGACLDKIAQMVRVYYEHPDHGGRLLVYQRCGNCHPEDMTENNCTFGTLVTALRKQGRDAEIDGALFALETSVVLSNIKKARNDITHRLNKKIFTPGLDPHIKITSEDGIQTTTFTFGGQHPTLNDYRKIIADAHNEIVMQLNIVGPKVFPPKKTA